MSYDIYTSVTFIVPTENGRRTLETCLKSIAGQRYVNVMAIFVVESGVADFEVKEICKKFPKVQYFYCPYKGKNHSRNFVLNEVQSKYVAFVDDNVELTSLWVEWALEAFTLQTVAAAGGNIVKREKPFWFQMLANDLERRRYWENYNSLENPKVLSMLNASAVMLRTDILKKLNGFDTNFHNCEGAELSLRLYRHGYSLFSHPKMMTHVFRTKNRFAYFFLHPISIGFYSTMLFQKYGIKFQQSHTSQEKIIPLIVKVYDSLVELGISLGMKYGKAEKYESGRLRKCIFAVWDKEKGQPYLLNPRYSLCFNHKTTTLVDVNNFHSYILEGDHLFRKMLKIAGRVELDSEEARVMDEFVQTGFIIKGLPYDRL